jgi:HEAT repeat protein
VQLSVKKRLVIAVILVGVALLAAVWIGRRSPELLVFQGKSVRDWALEYSAQPSSRAEVAASALQALGSNAVPGLVRMLGAKDSYLRRRLWAVGPALPVVVQRSLLKHVRPPNAARTRSAAAKALALMGPPARAAVPALARIMGKDEYLVRFSAAIALAHIGGPGIPVLAGYLTNNDVNVRYAAVSGLGESAPEAAAVAPELLKMVADPNDGVRVAAVGSFLKLGTNILPFLTHTMVNGNIPERRNAVRTFARMPVPWRQAVPPLLGMLQDPDPACRVQAMQRLSAFPALDTNMITAFIAGLADPEAEVRLAAIRGLGQARARGAPAVLNLAAFLNDPSPAVRQEAARALGAIGAPAEFALPELARLVGDKEAVVGTAAKEAMGKIEQAKATWVEP